MDVGEAKTIIIDLIFNEPGLTTLKVFRVKLLLPVPCTSSIRIAFPQALDNKTQPKLSQATLSSLFIFIKLLTIQQFVF